MRIKWIVCLSLLVAWGVSPGCMGGDGQKPIRDSSSRRPPLNVTGFGRWSARASFLLTFPLFSGSVPSVYGGRGGEGSVQITCWLLRGRLKKAWKSWCPCRCLVTHVSCVIPRSLGIYDRSVVSVFCQRSSAKILVQPVVGEKVSCVAVFFVFFHACTLLLYVVKCLLAALAAALRLREFQWWCLSCREDNYGWK